MIETYFTVVINYKMAYSSETNTEIEQKFISSKNKRAYTHHLHR